MRDTYHLILAGLMLIAGVALYADYASAQPADDDSAGEPDATEDPVTDLLETVGEVPGAIDGIKEAKGDKTAMFMAVCVLIGIILKILLSLLKLTGAAIFKNKTFLKVAPLVIGLLIFLVSHFAAGTTWYDALILAAGGPGAILFHEVWKLLPVAQDSKE